MLTAKIAFRCSVIPSKADIAPLDTACAGYMITSCVLVHVAVASRASLRCILDGLFGFPIVFSSTLIPLVVFLTCLPLVPRNAMSDALFRTARVALEFGTACGVYHVLGSAISPLG